MTLVAIENSNVLLTRFIRSNANADQLFKIGDMMLVTELCKVVLAMMLELWHSRGQLTTSLSWHNLLSYQSLIVALPAVLYFVQNSLFYVALTNLASPLFQVLYQLKLLITAIVSVLLLQRMYSAFQWISLCALTFGVIIALKANDGSSNDGVKSNAFIGIVAVIVACFCSAFAGVGFEKLLKQDSTSSSPSLWMRNIQLGTYSVVVATLQLLLSNRFDGQQEIAARKPFLFGFSSLVWTLAVLRASCGLLVAIIIKHMDNVVKSITSSVSVLAGCLISSFLLGDVLDWKFWFGAGVVAISSYMFSQPPNDAFSLLRKRWVTRLAFSSCFIFSFLSSWNAWNFSFRPYTALKSSAPMLYSSVPKYSSVPDNYSQYLHFIIQVRNYKDCGGCDVLWELYHTLLAQNFSANTSFSIDNVAPDRAIVVIYPEVSFGTWGHGDIHVHWILAPVGTNGPAKVTKKWNQDDLVFNYATSTGVDVPVSNVLQVVNSPTKADETDISDELFYSKNRSGIAWMMRKGHKFHPSIIPIHDRPGFLSTNVDKRPRLMDLRKFEYFVSYDPYTYWTWFAAMMGTVSIVYPLANVSKAEWALGTFPGAFMQDQQIKEIPGVAYGWEESEIKYARETMHDLRPFLLRLRKWGAEVTVQRFTRDCYRYSQGEREHFEGARLVKDVYPQPA